MTFWNYLFPDRRIPWRRIVVYKLEKIMSALTDLQDQVAAVKSSLAGIRQDIIDIKNGLPAAGGLTAAEVATLSAALAEVVTDASGLDAENPTPASDPVQ